MLPISCNLRSENHTFHVELPSQVANYFLSLSDDLQGDLPVPSVSLPSVSLPSVPVQKRAKPTAKVEDFIPVGERLFAYVCACVCL